MTPIVFCASFVPCVKATNPPETSWSRLKTRFTRPGARLRTTHMTASMSAAAPTIPKSGARSDGIATFSTSPFHCTTPNPPAAMAEPTTPPMSAWLELDGRPRYHVIRFHVIAPTRPARTTSSVTTPGSTMSLATVAATSKETNAPATFRIAALRTAARGESARVETLVAIEFAVSWNPFVKSKKRATATTATRVRSSTLPPPLRVLDDDIPHDVGRGLAGVERILERLEDVLPADDDQGVDARGRGRGRRWRRGPRGLLRPPAP